MKLKPFYIVEPKDWFFSSQKDILVAKKRALAYLKKNGTYTGAEKEIEESNAKDVPGLLKDLEGVYIYCGS